MRAFISIDIPEYAKDEILNIQKEMEKKKLFNGRMTSRLNLHLTLKFLGEISDEQAESVKEKLKSIKFKNFKVKLSDIGVFSEDFVKIIWLKLDGKDILELQRQIDEALKGLFPKEERFMSHLTIARVKSTKDKKKLLDFLKTLRISSKAFEVNEFILKKSDLKPTGPIYTEIEKYKLGSK